MHWRYTISAQLTTKELLIISLYQVGNTPSAIALRLGVPATNVRQLLKSPKAMAYRLEQEETTDELLHSLYRDGTEALRRALCSSEPKHSLRAAEIVFKILGKMKGDDSGVSPKIHIEKLLNVIQAPITPQELEEASRFVNASRVSAPKAAIQGATTDSE